MNETTSIDLDSLLDGTLDDLADLPESVPFHAGGHKISLSLAAKEINSKPAIEASLKLIQTVELANPSSDTPQEPGTETNVLYFLDNEFGAGKFKQLAVVLGAAMGTGSIKEIVSGCKDIECIAITTQRKNKNTGDMFTDIKEISVG